LEETANVMQVLQTRTLKPPLDLKQARQAAQIRIVLANSVRILPQAAGKRGKTRGRGKARSSRIAARELEESVRPPEARHGPLNSSRRRLRS
jgi:hypothetical protein